jgi:uncharacterized protein YdcH (DUF465 family)
MVIAPPLDLSQEFPEHKNKVQQLKASNTHFRHMFDEYHEINHQLNRIEQEIETVSNEFSESLKKKRLQLKDSLIRVLHEA